MPDEFERRLSALEAQVENHQTEVLRLRDGLHSTRDEMTSIHQPLTIQVGKLETEFFDFKKELQDDFKEMRGSVGRLDGMSKDFHLMLNIGKSLAALTSAIVIAWAVKALGLIG